MPFEASSERRLKFKVQGQYGTAECRKGLLKTATGHWVIRLYYPAIGIIEIPVEEKLLTLNDDELIEALKERAAARLAEIDQIYEDSQITVPEELVGIEIDVEV